MNVNLDLEGYEDEDDGRKTGIALPYVVTIDKGTTEILAIRRNWNQDDDKKKRVSTLFIMVIYQDLVFTALD